MKETMSSSICHVLMSLVLLLLVLMHEPTLAIKQSYIVYLGSHSFGPNPSSFDIESATNSHYDLLGSYLGSSEKAKEAILYSYNRNINGFAAILDEDEAAEVAKHPNVVSIFLNKKYELLTTRSWGFLGLERDGGFPMDSLWKKTLGEDIIIGNLDSGVWPESKSFSDSGFGPIPKKWRGICQVTKENEDKFYCNRKLIGARYFYKGYEAKIGKGKNMSYNSARDTDGHGTHTLSTAGGNAVVGVNVFGNGNGTASGGSPKARVAAYKVCWDEGCSDADILAGFEAAISDGVDVLSVSLGGSRRQEYATTSISIGSFHAVANNIIVVAAGGNSGPFGETVTNLEPWILTVAASTIDRDLTSSVILGNKKILKGASLSELVLPTHKSYPLINAANANLDNASHDEAIFCTKGTLDPHKANGKILVCLRGGGENSSRVDKGVEASSVGAVGMILANDKNSAGEVIADPHVLPASHVNFTEGEYIFNYVNHTKFPMAYITKVETQLGVTISPIMASFSSRGPNILDPEILKPDITAPGVNIIAAYSEAVSPTGTEFDKRRTPFMIDSGTSMACPHVAGLAGLLKALHPDWSAAAIKSAIMTTAKEEDNVGRHLLDSSLEEATPFAYGAGHIQPNLAADPGLVYDLNITDYLNFLCGHGYTSSKLKLFYERPHTCPKSYNLAADFNYPSITIPHIKSGENVSVTRTVTNVGSPSTYTALIKAPAELLVLVEPKRLIFEKKGERKQFNVTLTWKEETNSTIEHVFGKLVWTDGKHSVGSTIVINNIYP